MITHPLVIGGQLVSGTDELPVINPATERVFALASRGNQEHLDQAVAAAKAASIDWGATSLDERQTLLSTLSARVEARRQEFEEQLTLEVGKPAGQSRLECSLTIGLLKHFSMLSLPDREHLDTLGTRVEILWKPLGVVAGITPWNMPLMQPALKLGAALATGNTIVIKPAPTTPLTALLLGAEAAGVFPPGVVNVVIDDHDLGPRLTEHPDVAKLAFTGSTATGRKIISNSAASIKRLTMELGGSDPAIVLRDADVPAAAARLYSMATLNCGQICTAPKRIYVHNDIFDEFAEAMVRLAKASVVGDGTEPTTTIGPLQNAEQLRRALGYIEDARENGEILAGGHRLDRPGYFVEPTIVVDMDNGTRLVDEEQFSPIIPLIRFGDEVEVIVRANANPYGLGGSVWSADHDRARKMAARLDCGTSWINQHGVSPSFDIASGGVKQSGIGVELGVEGLRSFQQRTAICG